VCKDTIYLLDNKRKNHFFSIFRQNIWKFQNNRLSLHHIYKTTNSNNLKLKVL